jgi:tetratricopeptide (TPR) repeat protein
MKRVLFAAAALSAAWVPSLFAAQFNLQETEQRCHDYTIGADAQIAACTPLIRLYGEAIENAGLSAVTFLTRGTAYSVKGDRDRAMADYKEAIRRDSIPLDAGTREPILLNDRCWARAIAMIDLDAALADCNEALRLRPEFTPARDSRAFLNLKRGVFRDALTDYDAVLKEMPMNSYSLYGRGVTKLRLGDRAGGNADIATAVAAEKGIRQEFAAYGVTP